MKKRFAAVVALVFAAAGSQQTASAQASSAAYAPSASELRLWQLIDRDRPHNLLEGDRYDSKDSRRMNKEIKRQAELMIPAAADYRRTRSVAARRKLLEIVNRGGMRWDDRYSAGTLLQAFRALDETGPPLNDPDNGNDPEFGAKRHRALLRLMAFNIWRVDLLNDLGRRPLAAYLRDCERRPSLDRPSGNNHDPSCGFIFELKYADLRSVETKKVGWDESRVPQSFAEFAAGIPSTRPSPEMEGAFEYPLVPKRPATSPDELWAGNRTKLAQIYARPYFASREYFERRAAEGAVAMAAERKRADDMAAYRQRLILRWDAMWQRTNLSPSEQAELENMADSLYRLDIYRTRYNIISYDRLTRYCELGFTYECSRKAAIDGPAREERRMAQGNWSSGPARPSASQSVTVRSYDRNGNYTGSSVTTRLDAELMGAH